MSTPVERYRSPDARARFDAALDELLATWPVAVTSRHVTTDFGDTHVLMSGPDDAPPLLLLPGGQGTAAMWGAFAGGLRSPRRLLCVDIVDQVGRSEPVRVLASPADASDWLGQVLDGLDQSRVDMGGNSIGAFIAASFASAHPERVDRLILMAPAATVAGLSPSYVVRALLALHLPWRGAKARFLLRTGGGAIDESDALFRVLLSAMLGSRPVSRLVPVALGDEALARLAMPLLVIFGAKDEVNVEPSSATAARLARRAGTRCEQIEGAGHLWSSAQFRAAASITEAFL